jgi:hypothetical protein
MLTSDLKTVGYQSMRLGSLILPLVVGTGLVRLVSQILHEIVPLDMWLAGGMDPM